MEKIKKFFKNKYILLIALLMLIVFLATSIGIMANEKGTKIKGEINADNYVATRSTYYKLEVQNEFKEGIKEFVLDFFGLEDPSLISNAGTSSVLDAFRKSSISAEKALSFSRYVKDLVDPEEVWDLENVQTKKDFRGFLAVYAFFCDIEETEQENEEGEKIKKLVFNPSKYILDIFNFDMYSEAVTEIVDNTMLTIDEIAKIFYEIMYGESKEENITRKDFVAIFRTFSYLTTMLQEFREKGGTLPQARLLGEFIYQSGSEIDEMINRKGVDYILNAFGVNAPLPSLLDDPKYSGKIEDPSILEAISLLEDIRKLVKENNALIKFLIISGTESMMKIENASFEGIARVETPGDISPLHHKYHSMISFSRSIYNGFKKGMAQSEIKDVQTLKSRLTTMLVTSRSIDTPFATEEEKSKYELEVSGEVDKYVTAVYGVYENFGEIKDAAQIKELENIELLDKYYEDLTDYSGTVLGVYKNLISTVFVNSAINLFLQMQDKLMLDTPKVPEIGE